MTATYTVLDALKYLAIYTHEQIDFAQDRIGGTPEMTEELEAAIEPGMEMLDAIAGTFQRELSEWCHTDEERNRYSDGRPIWTCVELPEDGYTFSYLWPPDPNKKPSPGHDCELPSGRIVTVSFHLPSEVRVEYTGWWKPTNATTLETKRHLHAVDDDS